MVSEVTVEHSVTSDGGLPPAARIGWTEGLLVALVLLWFGRCAGYGFLLWDDQTYLVDNPVLRDWSWAHVRAVFTPGAVPAERLYAPLTYLTLLGGQSAALIPASTVLNSPSASARSLSTSSSA